jgi:hypothetical protein
MLRKEYRFEVPQYRQLRIVCVSEGDKDREPEKKTTQGLLFSK